MRLINWAHLIIITSVHFITTVIVTIWVIIWFWGLSSLPQPQTIPIALTVLKGVSVILYLPLMYPFVEIAHTLGYEIFDPFKSNFCWLLPVFNSATVAYVILFACNRFKKKRED
jgi:hypothetical protein